MKRNVNTIGVLKEHNFFLYWIGQLTSSIGDSFVPVAVTFAVLKITDSAVDLGIVLGSLWGAKIVFLLLGGVWSDKLPRQMVMIATDVVRAAVHFIVAFLFFFDQIQIWHLAVAAGIFGMAGAFFSPAASGVLPKLVASDNLQQANALLSVSQNFVMIFGPALSGILVHWVGFGTIFFFDACTFLISAVCLAFIPFLKTLEKVEQQSLLKEAKEGFYELLRHRWLWATTIAFALQNFVIACYNVLGPLVMEKGSNGSTGWGFILMGGSIGAVLGGVIAIRFRPVHPLFYGLIFMAVFVPLEVLVLVPPLPVSFLILFSLLGSLSIVVADVIFDTLLQQHIPDQVLSRVYSVESLVTFIFMPLGFVLAGPLADRFGLPNTLIFISVLAFVGNLVAWHSRVSVP
ncbi:MFS transporter [Shimazuella sp. AN120528]|uniref:MFS transporter n=1 Tax=Shimazuella soli TaxID=1892854 RepID=UPI001F0D5B63|nr:MFS transporter [Shimazuella soli]MCH5586071.1 MFS transporter [Shimazuella soli]